jgi:phosphonate transport system permease protein
MAPVSATARARSALGQAALDQRATLEKAHPLIFHPTLFDRLKTPLVVAAMAALLVYGLAFTGFTFTRVWNGIGQLGTFVVYMIPPSYGTTAKLWTYLHALAETIAIAFLGTILAALFAVPLGFLAARNAMANRVVQFLSRRFLDTIRGVDTLIWALIWINVVGLGPFAGVLAIMTSDIGSFGKLFSEAIEAVDKKPSEGVVSTGGSFLHRLRFGIFPEVVPVMASQVLYYIESNTRSATIIGIVGAGGIGLLLSEKIRTLEWQEVSFLIILILIAVAAIDWVSTKLRFAIIGEKRMEG